MPKACPQGNIDVLVSKPLSPSGQSFYEKKALTMMSTRVPLVTLVAVAVFAFGCASAGGGNDLSPVPVYAATDPLPCEYEVIQTVRGSSPAQNSRAAFERIRADVLGRAGANIGADAVITSERNQGGTQRGWARQPPQPPPPPPRPPLLRFEGEAIRFIPCTCRTA